jgi:hypothetical protein
MEAYQERVVKELADLQANRTKLGTFLSGPDIAKVPPDEKALLFLQHDAMLRYERILEERISLYPKEEVST